MTPSRIEAFIIQNGDIPYEDALGPKYADIEKTWSLPDDEMLAELRKAVTYENFRDEFLNDVREELAALIPPDLWELHWSQTFRSQSQSAMVSASSQLPASTSTSNTDRLGTA